MYAYSGYDRSYNNGVFVLLAFMGIVHGFVINLVVVYFSYQVRRALDAAVAKTPSLGQRGQRGHTGEKEGEGESGQEEEKWTGRYADSSLS